MRSPEEDSNQRLCARLLMETLEQIKARIETALPGAKIEIVPNAVHHNKLRC